MGPTKAAGVDDGPASRQMAVDKSWMNGRFDSNIFWFFFLFGCISFYFIYLFSTVVWVWVALNDANLGRLVAALSAVYEQFRANVEELFFRGSFGAVLEQFQFQDLKEGLKDGANLEHFKSIICFIFRANSEEIFFRSSFGAVSEQFRSSFIHRFY